MSYRRVSAPFAFTLAALLAVSSAVGIGGAADAGTPAAAAGCTTGSTVAKPTLKQPTLTSTGNVRISWTPSASCVTGFKIHLGLEHFGSKGAVVLSAKKDATSIVVSKANLKKLRAPLGSGRHFTVRMQAVNGSKKSVLTASRITAAGQPKSSRSSGSAKVLVASYNLAFTPELSSGTLKSRRPGVAKQIVKSGASVLAIQESVVIAGRDDTQLGSLTTQIRKAQKKTGKSAAWRWVRSTRYAAPGVSMGGDGTRILYNNKQVKLLSGCSDTTGGKKYSTSCTIKLPRIGGAVNQRWGAIARFQDRKTGKKFWVVSAHLEVRKGSSYDKNRSAQLKKIVSTINKKNTRDEPVLLAGDLNLSPTRGTDLKTLNSRLTAKGYVNAITADTAYNLEYQTYNGWKKPVVMKSGHAGRIDHIFAHGNVHLSTYKTVLSSASDHHLIKAVAWLK
ncbi:endonuclease/exonuclease/phosphatase family protein [Leucobacter soli]|uniref:Endonuclease/exonuclease/phosphatase domain-containing protein n=1 Tax=Leucobacter soli TaxID=2812850 RepID=A0A916NUM1_9MICO|nr:endonuclease/exonuclease/phosphatase family protein [Leucobacter soli]CAG7598712.1 hypothetical protein LEUCIP111803_00249 [Leucobacter soli]